MASRSDSSDKTNNASEASASSLSPVAQRDPVDTTTATEKSDGLIDPKDDDARTISTAGDAALPHDAPDVVQSPHSYEGAKLGMTVYMQDFINNNRIEFPATVTGIHLNGRCDLHATPPGQAPRNMNGIKHADDETRLSGEECWSKTPRLSNQVDGPYVAQSADKVAVTSSDAADPSYRGIHGHRYV